MLTRKPGWKLAALPLVVLGLGPSAISTIVPTANAAQKIIKNEHWRSVIIQKGDTLSHIFKRLKIKQTNLSLLSKQHKEITFLSVGKTLYFKINADRSLQALKFPVNAAKTLVLEKQGKVFVTHTKNNPTTTALLFKSATINRSLHSSALHAGMTPNMLSQMQNIFKNSANFSHVQQGDHLAFLYKEYYVNGKPYQTGDIVAAEFTHHGKTYRAIRYQSNDHVGYYTPDGHGLEARFLNAPLSYRRISSPFNLHRYDPILHQIKPHLGVDYAAQDGTPIKSIGEGRVIFIGHDGGYGREVKIRYDQHEVGLYAHMHRFAKNLQLHQLVHKGEIIGYVGTSGWATGPHLHFGFYVDGKPRNWLAMKTLTGNPIPANYRKQFLATSHLLFSQLHFYENTQLAMNSPKNKHSHS